MQIALTATGEARNGHDASYQVICGGLHRREKYMRCIAFSLCVVANIVFAPCSSSAQDINSPPTMERESLNYEESPGYREALGHRYGYNHPGQSNLDPLSDYGRGFRLGQIDREDDDALMGAPGADFYSPWSLRRPSVGSDTDR